MFRLPPLLWFPRDAPGPASSAALSMQVLTQVALWALNRVNYIANWLSPVCTRLVQVVHVILLESLLTVAFEYLC